MEMLKHAHSGFRWILLAFLLYAIYNAFTGWRSNRAYGNTDRKINLFTMISAHIMLLLGLALYVLGERYQINSEIMKTPALRFYAVEHISMMLLAIILITIGNGRAKRGKTDLKKFKVSFWLFLIALFVILAAIPWPPKYGAGWF